jgi:phage-related protein
VTTPGGEVIGEASIEVEFDLDPAIRQLQRFSRQLNQIVTRATAAETGLADLDSQILSLTRGMDRFGDATNDTRDSLQGLRVDIPDLTQQTQSATEETDRSSLALTRLAGVAGSVGSVLGRVALGIGAIGAAAGSSLPLLAGVVTALQNVAPAGAAAATGFLAIRQAAAVVQLGMIGIEDAVKDALDTANVSAADFEESLKGLAPTAREFARAVRELAPEFRKFQQGIQLRLFTDFGDELGRLSDAVMPVLRQGLNETAETLNRMALGASGAARTLATDGTLGKAMAGANEGLLNLRRVPGQVVTALGRLAAAGAPAFDRLTNAVAGVADKISERLGAAFESGALEDSVNNAVDLLRDLAGVIGNVFGALRNVLDAASTAGGGTFAVLTKITQAIEDATATEGFQNAIGALVDTMGVLATTAGPLLASALAAVGPVFTALAGPAQNLIRDLGEGLSPIIDALGPVLGRAATTVGVLVEALSPLLPVIGELIAALLPALSPVLDALTGVFGELGQVISRDFAPNLRLLTPVFASLTPIIAAMASLIARNLVLAVRFLGGLLQAIQPALARLSVAFVRLSTELAPLIEEFTRFTDQVLVKLAPLIPPILAVVGKLASLFGRVLSGAITGVVIPAIRALVALLRGDFSAAWKNIQTIALNVVVRVPAAVRAMVRSIIERLSVLVTGLSAIANRAFGRFRDAAADRIRSAVDLARGIPGRIRNALSNLGTVLYNSGRSLIQGFIDGIRDKIDDVGDAASAAAQKARNFFGFSPAKEGPLSGRGWTLFAGEAFAADFAAGIAQRTNVAVTAASGLTEATAAALPVGVSRTPAAAPAAAPSTIQVTFINQGVIGSQADLDNWLTSSIDRLRNQRRIA